MLRQVSRPQLTLSPRRILSHPSLAPLAGRAPLSRLSPCIRLTPPPILSRSYAQGPPRGNQGGFPGFPMGQPRQKGEALKEYVSSSPSLGFTQSMLYCPMHFRLGREDKHATLPAISHILRLLASRLPRPAARLSLASREVLPVRKLPYVGRRPSPSFFGVDMVRYPAGTHSRVPAKTLN